MCPRGLLVTSARTHGESHLFDYLIENANYFYARREYFILVSVIWLFSFHIKLEVDIYVFI